MNKIIFTFTAVALYFAVGQALQCYQCKVGFWNLCITTTQTCAAGQQCFSGLGIAAGFVDIKMKGCLDVSSCNKTESTSFPNINTTILYQMNKTCCATDLCNSAPSHVHVSAVNLALTTITSVFIVKLLI